MPTRPVVYLALRVEPARFHLSSFTANLGPLFPTGGYDQDLICEVPPEFVARNIEVRVRLNATKGPVRATVLGWSSAFEDKPHTPEDERSWTILDSTPVPSAGVIVLTKTFQPFRE